MNLSKYLDIAPEVKSAVLTGRPVVALESAILSHDIPYPQNLTFAAEIESTIRANGVIPATIAIINGRLKVGLSGGELELMCRGKNIQKVSRRDLPIILATGGTGATTTASTMILASLAGIRVFCTNDIGGVRRGAATTLDISADLQELARAPVAVVCSGTQMTLDIGMTLEYLETMGVPVLGYRTSDFPAFYCRKSGFEVDYAAPGAADIAKILRTKWDMGLQGGVVVGNPIPEAFAMDFDEMNQMLHEILEQAHKDGIHEQELSPYLLTRFADATQGRSLTANIQLACNNARVAADIARELALLK